MVSYVLLWEKSYNFSVYSFKALLTLFRISVSRDIIPFSQLTDLLFKYLYSIGAAARKFYTKNYSGRDKILFGYWLD
jgi:hypothetical protein